MLAYATISSYPNTNFFYFLIEFLLAELELKSVLLQGVFNSASSLSLPPLLYSAEAANLPIVAPVDRLDSVSAGVKHSHLNLLRAFSMCCQCAGKNDFKLLSAQLLVHASRSHSNKPVTTQSQLLEKSTRAGLQLFIRASLNVHRVPNYFSIIEQAYRRTQALLHWIFFSNLLKCR